MSSCKPWHGLVRALTLGLPLWLLLVPTAVGAAGPVCGDPQNTPLTELTAPYVVPSGSGEPGLYPGGANAPSGDRLGSGEEQKSAEMVARQRRSKLPQATERIDYCRVNH